MMGEGSVGARIGGLAVYRQQIFLHDVGPEMRCCVFALALVRGRSLPPGSRDDVQVGSILPACCCLRYRGRHGV